jgi:regulator of protease activity HflC (stomatin/prohibitin superfamily)
MESLQMSPTLWTAIILVAFVVLVIKKTAVVVPQQSAYVIQRLGKYSRTLNAGFHILIHLFDTIAYRHSLKEEAVEVAEQVCITSDNVQVAVDGILYLKVLDPERTSYGINNYEYLWLN